MIDPAELNDLRLSPQSLFIGGTCNGQQIAVHYEATKFKVTTQHVTIIGDEQYYTNNTEVYIKHLIATFDVMVLSGLSIEAAIKLLLSNYAANPVALAAPTRNSSADPTPTCTTY